jgi:hypothetical protein
VKTDALKLTPSALISEKAINEASGIVKSRRFPNTYWVHNDSGDTARLFAIRSDGTLIKEIAIDGAQNTDWEDIATDGVSLFVGDVGNNHSNRKDLCIYQIPEPDPTKQGRASVTQKIELAYPDQISFKDRTKRLFDCEALFIFQKKLHLLTKQRSTDGVFPLDSTALYRCDRPGVLQKIDMASNLGGWITGADVSIDEKILAILCHFPRPGIWLFDLKAPKPLARPTHYASIQNIGQCEGICFDGGTIVISNEQRALFRVPIQQIPAFSGTRSAN